MRFIVFSVILSFDGTAISFNPGEEKDNEAELGGGVGGVLQEEGGERSF